MTVFIFTAILFAIALTLLLIARKRADGTAEKGLRLALDDFLHVLPRLAVGVIGAGFIAKAMPQEVITGWLGPSSGLGGTALAALAGALTPGGPVVGYAMAAATLKAGAGLPQVMAFVTGWSLYTIHRLIAWEVPTMPLKSVLIRAGVSLPFPFLMAWLVTFAGRM
jgi:uncharacterized membrane protein YraQ (UPF0718 family)